jgi:glycine dehydrogenase subunit 1
MRELGNLLEQHPTLFVTATYPISLGLLASPGEVGVDIAVAEGQPLGIPLSFGGPYLGLFATKLEYIRQMPGRLSGMTADQQGRRGYVMTLQAREQHIRRERATSNICSNQMLCATAATIYLALIGPQGLKGVAERTAAIAHRMAERLAQVRGCSLVFEKPFFNEFVLELPVAAEDVERELWNLDGIVAGLPLGRWWPERSKQMLFCATEVITDAALHRLVAGLEEVLA